MESRERVDSLSDESESASGAAREAEAEDEDDDFWGEGTREAKPNFGERREAGRG